MICLFWGGSWFAALPITQSPDLTMNELDPKRIVGDAEQGTAAPAGGRSALQNGLRQSDARGNLIHALAFKRARRNPQKKLQLLR